MLKKLVDIIHDELSINPKHITPESRIEDLNIDRKDLLCVVTDLEDEYDIIIDYGKLGDFVTINDLEAYVESKI